MAHHVVYVLYVGRFPEARENKHKFLPYISLHNIVLDFSLEDILKIKLLIFTVFKVQLLYFKTKKDAISWVEEGSELQLYGSLPLQARTSFSYEAFLGCNNFGS